MNKWFERTFNEQFMWEAFKMQLILIASIYFRGRHSSQIVALIPARGCHKLLASRFAFFVQVLCFCFYAEIRYESP